MRSVEEEPLPPALQSGRMSKPLALLALLAPACAPAPAEPPPSVLLVVVDTLRPDRLGLYGAERPLSPALDRFAEGALVFERAHANSSWTLPSMASLYSGRLPSAHGAGVRRGADGRLTHETDYKDFLALPEEVLTVAEAFGARGHATAGVVTNTFLQGRFGLAQGIQQWLHLGEARAGEVVDRGLEWLAAPPAESFFLTLHFFDPHLPYDAPAPFAGRYTEDLGFTGSRPVEGLGPLRARAREMDASEREFVRGAYDEEVAYLDHELGRLFAALEASGRLADTWIVVTSDHGEELFEHGGFEHGHSMVQEVLRVPLLVRGPGLAPGRSRAPVHLAAVGRALIAVAEGADPVEVFSELGGEEPVLAEGTLYRGHRDAIVDWPRKLVLGPAEGERRLVDLEAAGGEHEAQEDPGEAGRLEALFEERRRAALRLAPPERLARPSAGSVEALEKLGYLGED